MKTKIALWILSSFLACGGAASAALFDTRQQIEMRYGMPMEQRGEISVYEKDGFTITVGFIGGRAQRLVYKRRDRFSDYQIESILNANRGVIAWRWKKYNPTRWTLEGGRAEAIKRSGLELEIVSEDWRRIGNNAGGVEEALRPAPAVAGASTPPAPSAVLPLIPVGRVPGPTGGILEVSPKNERGTSIGPMKAGAVLRLRYVSGKWKSWGGIATACPDDPMDRGGDNKGGERNRLTIVNTPAAGPVDVLALVPAGTAKRPCEFVAPRDLENAALRINDTDGDWTSNPDGHVKYYVELRPPGQGATVVPTKVVSEEDRYQADLATYVWCVNCLVTKRAEVKLSGVVVSPASRMNFPWLHVKHNGTLVRLESGERAILVDYTVSKKAGESFEQTAVACLPTADGTKVWQETRPPTFDEWREARKAGRVQDVRECKPAPGSPMWEEARRKK